MQLIYQARCPILEKAVQAFLQDDKKKTAFARV